MWKMNVHATVVSDEIGVERSNKSSHLCDCELSIVISSDDDVVARATAFITNVELEKRTDGNITDYVVEEVAHITRLPVDGDGDYEVPSNGQIDVSIVTSITSLTA